MGEGRIRPVIIMSTSCWSDGLMAAREKTIWARPPSVVLMG